MTSKLSCSRPDHCEAVTWYCVSDCFQFHLNIEESKVARKPGNHADGLIARALAWGRARQTAKEPNWSFSYKKKIQLKFRISSKDFFSRSKKQKKEKWTRRDRFNLNEVTSKLTWPKLFHSVIFSNQHIVSSGTWTWSRW